LACAPHAFGDIDGARVVGAHFYPVSNAQDEGALIAELAGGAALAGRLRDEVGLPMSVVDLGGGFAAPYAQPGQRPRYRRLRAALADSLDAHLPGWRAGRPEVSFESGRYLVADCGWLICTAVEMRGAFLLLDSGIHHLGGMTGLGRLLRPAATPVAAPDGGQATRMTLAGPLCTPADVLGRDVPVPPVGAGDLVVFPNAGAYGLTASLLAFLSRPAPVEIALAGGRVVAASRLDLVRTVLE
jgi:diaminopimelate decarboxylase